MSLTQVALAYLAEGWSVIPVHVPVGDSCSCGRNCSWPGKHPRVNWRKYSRRLPTRVEVRRWFEDEFYGSNIGIVTGRVSRIVVLDEDEPGAIEHLDLPETLESRTGSGGSHFIYRIDQPVRSRPMDGYDIKADGGFIVLPPSTHKSGAKYEWVNVMDPTWIDPEDLPKDNAASSMTVNGEGWYESLLNGVREGERSAMAARLAGRYATIGLSLTEAMYLMHAWNEHNVPPMPSSELNATIRSVYSRHAVTNAESIGSLDDVFQVLAKMTGRSSG